MASTPAAVAKQRNTIMKSAFRARALLAHALGHRPVAAILVFASFGLSVSTASAQLRDQVIIRDKRAPLNYQLELEPHLVIGTNPPGAGQGSGAGIGARASLMVLPEGFLPRVNDSVAIGFGLDVGHYTGDWALQGYRDQCTQFQSGPNGTSICTQTTSNGGTYNYVYLPVVMQWNFWLTRRWSAFGEPGLDIYYLGNHGLNFSPAAYLGGRFHITDSVTLTGRIGYPTVALGVSFLM
jgi:hypothetical protein